MVSNNCDSNGSGGDGAGIHVNATRSDNRIEGNNLIFNNTGMSVNDSGNLIIKNSASGNNTDYDIVAGNDVGPIGSAATATSPWANIQF